MIALWLVIACVLAWAVSRWVGYHDARVRTVRAIGSIYYVRADEVAKRLRMEQVSANALLNDARQVGLCDRAIGQDGCFWYLTTKGYEMYWYST